MRVVEKYLSLDRIVTKVCPSTLSFASMQSKSPVAQDNLSQ